jgi:hypothetical protein
LEAFGRDAEHAAEHGGVLGVADGGVAEQGSDRGEAQVAGAGAVVAVGLEVLKEGSDHGLVELVPLRCGRR